MLAAIFVVSLIFNRGSDVQADPGANDIVLSDETAAGAGKNEDSGAAQGFSIAIDPDEVIDQESGAYSSSDGAASSPSGALYTADSSSWNAVSARAEAQRTIRQRVDARLMTNGDPQILDSLYSDFISRLETVETEEELTTLVEEMKTSIQEVPDETESEEEDVILIPDDAAVFIADVYNYLPLRDAPDPYANVLTNLEPFTEMYIIEDCEDPMVRVQTVKDAQVGYVNEKYIALKGSEYERAGKEEPTPIPTPTPTPSPTPFWGSHGGNGHGGNDHGNTTDGDNSSGSFWSDLWGGFWGSITGRGSSDGGYGQDGSSNGGSSYGDGYGSNGYDNGSSYGNGSNGYGNGSSNGNGSNDYGGGSSYWNGSDGYGSGSSNGNGSNGYGNGSSNGTGGSGSGGRDWEDPWSTDNDRENVSGLYVVIADGGSVLYESPSDSSAVVAYLDQGDSVWVVESAGGGYYYVQAQDLGRAHGYIRSSDIRAWSWSDLFG